VRGNNISYYLLLLLRGDVFAGFGGMTPVEADVLTASVGYERGLPCSIYYELYGTGPQKILFIMGTPVPALLSCVPACAHTHHTHRAVMTLVC
jgi:hypothetical protein